MAGPDVNEDLDRTPPHSREAEQAVLGAVLAHPSLFRHLVDELPLGAGDEGWDSPWYVPIHETIWSAMVQLHHTGRPVDPVTVLDHLTRSGELLRVGGAPYLHTLLTMGVATNVREHVQILLAYQSWRRAIFAASRATQLAWQPFDDPEARLQQMERVVAAVPSRDPGDVDSLMTADEFIDRDLGPVRWVIPGLLQVEERVIVTGGEGMGKSTLVRQIGMCAAAGMHPFDGEPFAPVKVLIIDVENTERQMRDRMDEIRSVIRIHGHSPGSNLWVDRKAGGLHLNNPAHVRWLDRRIDAVNPDVLVVGPAYKLFKAGRGDTFDESLAAEVTGQLDQVRERAGCAIVLEAHAAKKQEGRKRNLEPRGSALWMGWPEFGIGLAPIEGTTDTHRVCELDHWRGDRETGRTWPYVVESGGSGLPWVEGRPS